jgi:hypothetical protein
VVAALVVAYIVWAKRQKRCIFGGPKSGLESKVVLDLEQPQPGEYARMDSRYTSTCTYIMHIHKSCVMRKYKTRTPVYKWTHTYTHIQWYACRSCGYWWRPCAI